jgi:hypothetical protein
MSVVTSVISGVLGVLGTGKQAKESKEAGQLGGAISDINANIATQNAALARIDAKAEETRVRKSAEKLKGTQRAAFAASGVELGTGSPLLVLADTAREAEIEALTVRNRGEIKATGFEREAVGQKFVGEQQRRAGDSGAKSTILSGAGRLLKNF